MAKNTEKRAQISATVPANLKNALDDYRWEVRMNLSELVETALTEFALKNIPIFSKIGDTDTTEED